MVGESQGASLGLLGRVRSKLPNARNKGFIAKFQVKTFLFLKKIFLGVVQIPHFRNEDYSQGANVGGKNSKPTKYRLKKHWLEHSQHSHWEDTLEGEQTW